MCRAGCRRGKWEQRAWGGARQQGRREEGGMDLPVAVGGEGRGGLKVEASELADGLDSGTEGESVFRIF